MKKLKRLRRAGAFCLACVVFVLFSTGAYLQASEGDGTAAVISGAGDTENEESEISQTEYLTEHPTEEGGGQTEAPADQENAQTESLTEQESAQTEQPEEQETGQEERQTEQESAQTEGQTERESPQTAAQTETMTPAAQTGGPVLETEGQTEAETPAADTEKESGEEETEKDTESLLEDVLEEAQRQQIDFLGLAPGESLTFYATIGDDSGIMTMAAAFVTEVTVTKSPQPYRYSDYGYGSYLTFKYTVSFRDVTATAYCIQPSRTAPGSSRDFTVRRLKGAKELAKVCYYGTKAAGNSGYFAEVHPDFTEGQRFILTHMAASYANGSSDAFSGANQRSYELAMDLYNYCMAQPDIPDIDIGFSSPSPAAFVDPGDPTRQRTEDIEFQADPRQSVTFHMPAGVVLHDLYTNTTSTPGGTATITGGTRFYLSAPLTQAADTGEVWATTLTGKLKKDYSAYKITTGSNTQDLALVFGDGVDVDNEADFSVRWLNPVTVEIIKADAETGRGLAGVVFGIFADPGCQTLIQQLPATDAQGKASALVYRTQDIVYLREISPRPGYVNSARVEPVNLGELVQTTRFVSYTFTNERMRAGLRLIKRDSKTGTPQGDAVLSGAVYGLYAMEDILHPDGVTGVLFHAGDQVAAMTTDANGEAAVGDLYLGRYCVREISPPVGYVLGNVEHEVVFSAGDGSVPVIEKEYIAEEDVIRQPFQIIKIAGNGKTDSDPLEGAGFRAYLKSSLQTNADGSYDFTSAVPVVIGKEGATEIFTDEKGYAVSIPLPFGTYIVRETTVPAGYEPAEDFEVRIDENHPREPQAWRILIDKEFEAKLRIIKKDDETQRNVLAANTEFRVYDLDAEAYVEQVTYYPKEEKHTSYFTDEEGCLILPESLPRGHYRIEEVTAPEGYTVGGTSVEVIVDNNVAYRMDEMSDEALIEVVASNHPVKGKLRIVKKGEVLRDYQDDFVYEEMPLPGAIYEVYAAEDIYTADLQEDEAGNRILEYAKDTLVAELTTGENGEAVLEDLPLGTYRVTEKKAPAGYVHSEEEQYARFVYIDQNTPVVTVELEYVNDRQRTEIAAVKKDAENEAPLAGAEFGLFAKEEIRADGKVLVEADTQLATAVTGEDGRAVFKQDLPFGSYYVRELSAPKGYLPSEERVELTSDYEGQETKTVRLEADFEDEPILVDFTKSDITTGTELAGAELTVLDRDGTVIDSWISEKDAPHRIKGLHAGETYVLREEMAPYGYLRAEEVEFTVEETGEVQKVEMKDEVPVGRIVISKTGEFVDSVTWNEMVAGTIEAVFGYVSGSLHQIVFEVYAAEDIRAADGVSEDYYKKDELVAVITTDSLGYARTEDLPLGKYYVVEKKTGEGFVLDDKPRQIDLTYRDQDTPVVTYDEKWQNSRQRAAVTVMKKEKDTGRALAGAVFALCAGNDITAANGSLLMKADTVIEQKATGADGSLVFCADLPLGGTYYVKEVKAPAGYVTTGERREFTFSYAGESAPEVRFDYTFENQPTQVKISKSDITTGRELPGAKLQVRDEAGGIVDQWVSGTSPHMIQGLEAGKVYTLREESAPKGYVIAEEIKFRVKDTGKVQTVKMKDDCVEGKVLIHKTDQLTKQPLKGVEFELRDSKGRLLETLVTDGKGRAESKSYPAAAFKKNVYKDALVYTLKETKAQNGYRLDETEHEIRFSCGDGETPVVEYQLELKNERVGDAPKTGDETGLLPLTAAMVLSACTAAALAFGRKRKKKLS